MNLLNICQLLYFDTKCSSFHPKFQVNNLGYIYYKCSFPMLFTIVTSKGVRVHDNVTAHSTSCESGVYCATDVFVLAVNLCAFLSEIDSKVLGRHTQVAGPVFGPKRAYLLIKLAEDMCAGQETALPASSHTKLVSEGIFTATMADR